MKTTQLHSIFSAIVLLACAPFCTSLARAGAIQVNGTCQFGLCASTSILGEGGSLSQPFSFVYTFANSDKYQATGTFGAANLSNTSGYIEITAAGIMLTYLGNNAGSASGTDTLQLDFLQYFQTPFRTGSGYVGFESVSGVFGGPLANASSVEAQGISNGGTAMMPLGPFYPPDPFSASKSNQLFTAGPISLLDYRDTITFGAGSGIDSTISVSNTPSPTTMTPEPSSIFLVAGFAALLVFRSIREDKKT